MKPQIICILIALATLCGCRNNILYSHFVPVSTEKWHMDSVLRFDYTVTEADLHAQMLLYVRHTERYPYQNLWLFLGDSLRRDTIEFYLADDRGQWLGDKHHGFIEMPVLIEENRHFSDTGSYYLEVQHAMRDTVLRGITDIGLEIIKR